MQILNICSEAEDEALCIFISFEFHRSTTESEIILTFLQEETEAQRGEVST